jgi:predicted O-linked N-acetylglucosamine transferase (SPINDLY family)
MPHSFQINDERRSELPYTPTPARTEVGLPERGFVFCTFNATYKLNPACFASWARILQRVPESVLWLLGETPTVRQRLCNEAAVRGLDPSRLVFGARAPYGAHLARLRLAGLFLDSLPFNAGATASDALWAGVPVLTCSGEAFAARMGGSLLRALGLPELMTTDVGEYEQRAVELALDATQLAALTSRLAANRSTHALFNTETYCRNLESAYRHMWSRAEAGKSPASFTVPLS